MGSQPQALEGSVMTSMVDPVLLGQVLTGNVTGDAYSNFGWRVATSSDGQTVAISTPGENEETGRVQIFGLDPADGQWNRLVAT